MLPEHLKEHSAALAVDAFDGDAVKAGKFQFDELTLEIAPGKIASVCGFLKYDQKFVRLSTVTAVDRYPAEPRFEIVYHLHCIDRNQRLRLKCRLPSENPVLEPLAGLCRAATLTAPT